MFQTTNQQKQGIFPRTPGPGSNFARLQVLQDILWDPRSASTEFLPELCQIYRWNWRFSAPFKGHSVIVIQLYKLNKQKHK